MVTDTIIWKGDEVENAWVETSSYNSLEPVCQVSGFCFNDEGKVLLLKESGRDFWMLPGGTPEKGESFEEALVRELDEEASCIIGEPVLIGAVKVCYPNNPDEKQGENFFQLRFVAEVNKVNELTEDPDRGTKHERIFVSPEDFVKYVSWKKTGEVMIKVAGEVLKRLGGERE